MWRRESLVQIQMNYIDAHVARSRHADQRIHVRAVHVNQAARVMNDSANLANVPFKQPERVRIREHQSGHVAMRAQFTKMIEVGQSFTRRSNCLDGESRQMR